MEELIQEYGISIIMLLVGRGIILILQQIWLLL